MERFPGRGKAMEEIYLAGWGFWVFGMVGGIMAASIWKESGKGGGRDDLATWGLGTGEAYRKALVLE